MNKQNVEFFMKKDAVSQKQPYEKPQLSVVMLFADQVLTGCRLTISNGCGTANPVAV